MSGMAKRNKSQGVMGRTDIPLAQRMLMQKRETIAEHRNEAAMVAYYEDPDVGEAHLKRRLEQLGFIVKDGHMYCVENSETGEFVAASKLLEQKAKNN